MHFPQFISLSLSSPPPPFSHEQHFSQSPLYNHLAVRLLSTDTPPSTSHLPGGLRSPPFSLQPIQAYSLEVGGQRVNEWRTLPRFGACSSPRAHILYCGAAVQCTEWVPLPDDHPAADEQHLAVVTKPCVPFKLFQHDTTALVSCLQLWSLRGLPSKAASAANAATPPRLRYTVAIDDGPVLCVAFMPSGGFEADGRRLAVMALPTVGGDVRLVALPRPLGDGVPDGGAVRLKESTVLSGCEGSGQVSRVCWAKVSWFICCHDEVDYSIDTFLDSRTATTPSSPAT